LVAAALELPVPIFKTILLAGLQHMSVDQSVVASNIGVYMKGTMGETLSGISKAAMSSTPMIVGMSQRLR
jgi:hypothetical protein